jgi:hypothetical protein
MKVHHRRRRDDMLGFFVPGAVEVIIIGLGLAVFAAFIVGVVALFDAVFHKRKSRKSNPNLTPCPDCGHAVSIHASNCPQCGCPVGSGMG